MTTLQITPNWKNKTAKFKGTVAAGEHVAVRIINDDGAGDEFIQAGALANLRLRVVNPANGKTLAQFPEPVAEGETPDAWDPTRITPLECELNLNTVQMLKSVPPAANVPLLFVLDDYESKTLYFKDMCEVTHWPRRVGEEEPTDLDNYKDIIADFRGDIYGEGGFKDRVESAESAAESAAQSARLAAERAGNSESGAQAAMGAAQAAATNAANAKAGAEAAAENSAQAASDAQTAQRGAETAQSAAEAAAEAAEAALPLDTTLSLSGKAADAKSVGDALALKADKSNTYSKSETDGKVADEAQARTLLAATVQANAAAIATHTSSLASLSSRVGDNETAIAERYTKSEVDAKIAAGLQSLAPKASPVTIGNLASLKSDGSFEDSGIPKAGIPAGISADNPLVDKDFVNSSIATNTANYIYKTVEGEHVPFASVAELEAYTGPLTHNDYAFVKGTDSAGNTTYTRYKYNTATGQWAEEYVLNNSSFTAAQWAAINSGINERNLEELQSDIADAGNAATAAQTAAGAAQAAAHSAQTAANTAQTTADAAQETANARLERVREILWANLKTLRDNGGLVPGQQYRITDYVATTSYVATSTNYDSASHSANHPFDLIVTADSASALNERARAALHEGDTYFAASNLAAWEVWYSLDNNTTRFAWAVDPQVTPAQIRTDSSWFTRRPAGDVAGAMYPYCWHNATKGDRWTASETPVAGTDKSSKSATAASTLKTVSTYTPEVEPEGEPGKGVIYRLVDEYGNDCPYDFKGLQFHACTATDTYEDVWRYTFDSGAASGANVDLSLAGDTNVVYGNRISPCPPRSNAQTGPLNLPCNVFQGLRCNLNILGAGCRNNAFAANSSGNTFGTRCVGNILAGASHNMFGAECNHNVLGDYSDRNSFGPYCKDNTLGDNCSNNTFDAGCSDNTFDAYCSGNTLGNDCSRNTFGSYCSSNLFGSYCRNNTFDSDCYSNTFGPYCESNAFGRECVNNAFGSECNVNAFGSGCACNTFDTGCVSNMFGPYCVNNTFGTGCASIKFGTDIAAKSYCRNIHVASGNQYIHLAPSGTTSFSAYYQNVEIKEGVNNITGYKTIADPNVGQTFLTTYKPANSQDISL